MAISFLTNFRFKYFFWQGRSLSVIAIDFEGCRLLLHHWAYTLALTHCRGPLFPLFACAGALGLLSHFSLIEGRCAGLIYTVIHSTILSTYCVLLIGTGDTALNKKDKK